MRERSPLQPVSPPSVPKGAGGTGVEARMLELQNRFDQLHAQVRQAQQLASLGTAAATIAHEVNNLLTPVLGYITAALGCDDQELAKKALTVSRKNIEMLVAMSSRVLEISAAKKAERGTVFVRQAVDGAIESLCRDLDKDGIQLSIEVDESLTVEADSLQLQQALFNLFLNAREAMAPSHNGRLNVTADAHEQTVIIRVRNTGSPIPVEIMDRLFEPLSSSKPAMRDGHARCGGLGLSLCRDLIEENGGTIKVSSDEETGTTFTITLPSKA